MGWQDPERMERTNRLIARREQIEQELNTLTLADFRPADLPHFLELYGWSSSAHPVDRMVGGGDRNMDILERRIEEIRTGQSGQSQEASSGNGGRTVVEFPGAAANGPAEG